MNEENLKPCPFCGGKAILSAYGVNPSVFEIECTGCGCYQHEHDSKQNVIYTWNKRIGDNE